MYIRSKTIKGHRYFYLVQGTRDGRTVRQIVIRYLGKHPGAHTLYPVAFNRIVTGWYQWEFERIFYRLGVNSITYDGPELIKPV